MVRTASISRARSRRGAPGAAVQDDGERRRMLEPTRSDLPSVLPSTAFVPASMVAPLSGGVLADRIDRRRIVIASQLAQAIVAGAVGTAAVRGWVSPGMLLVGAAAIGPSSAPALPPWQAPFADLVAPGHGVALVTARMPLPCSFAPSGTNQPEGMMTRRARPRMAGSPVQRPEAARCRTKKTQIPGTRSEHSHEKRRFVC